MLNGSLTKENLINALRSISQKRKGGILYIQSHDTLFEVTFLAGRIVDITEAGWCIFPAICSRLVISSRLSETQVVELRLLKVSSLKEIYAAIVNSGLVSHHDFMMAKESLSLDMLHALFFLTDGLFRFDSQIVNFEENLSLKLSTGQLLLDCVEFESNNLKYKELLDEFGVFYLSKTPNTNIELLNTHELELLRAIGDGGICDEVLSRALLSGNDCRSVLFSLYHRGLVEISSIECDTHNQKQCQHKSDSQTEENYHESSLLSDNTIDETKQATPVQNWHGQTHITKNIFRLIQKELIAFSLILSIIGISLFLPIQIDLFVTKVRQLMHSL